MRKLSPISIVGGGLAGLSLGIALRRAGVPTVVFEAGDYPRHRVCGEFVTGLSVTVIEKLGIDSVFIETKSCSSVKWLLKGNAIRQTTLPTPALMISRYALDARLAKLFESVGGKLLTRTRVSPRAIAPGWIQASGRRPSGESRWLGLKLHARDVGATKNLEFDLGNYGYVGLSSVEDGWTNICGLFRRRPELRCDRDEIFGAYLKANGLEQLARRLEAAEVRPGSRKAVAGFVFDRNVNTSDGLRLGDASAMIPPFTGDGMAMAFTSAALAVDPLIDWARGERSWGNACSYIMTALCREFRLRLTCASLFHPFILGGILQRCFRIGARARALPINLFYHLVH